MVTEIKVDELLYRERQNAIKDPLDWETRKQINELYNDARQAELSIKWLEDEMKRIAFWSTLSVGFTSVALMILLWNWS